MTTVHWHVLGAGAIGCLFASQLQRAGCATTLVLREGCNLTSARLRIEQDGTSHCMELPVSSATQARNISHLLVTTKAQDVRPAVLSVAHRLDASSHVLLLANGLGYAGELRAQLPQPEYFFGSTTAGAYRLDDQLAGNRNSDRQRLDHRHIRHAGSGLTRVGQAGRSTAPAWFRQWSAAVQPSVWDDDIEQALWLKLAINCAINPLTAIHRCANGELAGAELAPQVERLCEEIMRVSAAAGFATGTADLPQRVAEVIQGTAQNRSSMLQDVLAGRTTEIEYITGHLLRVAREHAVAAPYNEALFRRLLNIVD